ncbi:MAG: 1-deoxy-D-xylulose-5-phosphate synthase [Deltaproteobacteria bacterium]|jgi:1-deoxy-D-xylulose-5-phosphate synthase|nr:1-deoxy-D-xylulose-5-phosphate synthase [Deltaproteobacteria bacterium]|tara:strand:- start:928 stop:2862 length:1935 start_codon:yes stop_codon:yes gene_type:complete
MLDKIPLELPPTPILDRISIPKDLRELQVGDLKTLAEELRLFLLYSVGQTGGHFGAGLGVVELTIALHYVYNTPTDNLVWDVGHQAYPHKILTDRRARMLTMRQAGGLAPFPSKKESPYDAFGVGHSSTSISAALGMLVAGRMKESDLARSEENHNIAVIGDGAMTAGMAFEALNHAGHIDDNILVILNDNNMSISDNVGGLSSYFARMWASKPYNFIRSGSKRVLSKVPPALKAIHRAEEYMKGMVSPGTLFEELGFNYIGLIDGHNVEGLVDILTNIKSLRGPQLLHIVTQKGKGYTESESDPHGMHALSKVTPQKKNSKNLPNTKEDARKLNRATYSQVFGEWLCDVAKKDKRLIAVTPAMGEGSGMNEFAEKFPDRFFDVAIAEQHAVTFAAGIACGGQKPVIAIYSTFLQRAYDQLIHDVALQELDVLFAIDRAGLVGEDGPTHAGSFDLCFLRCIPNLVIMTPSDEAETYKLLSTGFQHKGPAAVRYPRGKGTGASLPPTQEKLDIGKGILRRKGKKIALLAFGSLVAPSNEVGERLNATVADMRFVKPIDEVLISELAKTNNLLVTLEENSLMGGAGSAVNEFLIKENLNVPVLNIGLPDAFLEHGQASDMLAKIGLDAEGIIKKIQTKLSSCGISQ